jgi:hypothetical protein
MREDLGYHGGIFDGGDDLQGAVTLGTLFNSDSEHPDAAGSSDTGRRQVMGCVAVIVCGVIRVDRPARNGLWTQPGVEHEHAMEANAAGVGTRNASERQGCRRQGRMPSSATWTLPTNPGMDALNEMEPWKLGQAQPAAA